MLSTIFNIFTKETAIKDNKFHDIELNNPNFNRQDAVKMLHLVNSVRISKRLHQLNWNENLHKIAKKYSYTMFQGRFFSHSDLNGLNHMDRISAIIPIRSFCTAGENLAINANVNKAHIALCDSKGHYENIINPNYYACGIGVFSPNPDYVWVTQLFLG